MKTVMEDDDIRKNRTYIQQQYIIIVYSFLGG